MPTRLTGAVLAALCLIAPAQAQGSPTLLKLSCGYALYLTCYVDPAAYGEARTAAGCRAAAIKALGPVDGPKTECVGGDLKWVK